MHGPPSELQAATSSTPGTKTALAQQHARRHRQQQQQCRIAAIKASAAAVQEWTSAQLERSAPTAAAPAEYKTRGERAHVTSRELGQLRLPVLQLLSTEAQQGLLHLQALRLLPPQLEVTHALIGAPSSECCITACSAATVTPAQPACVEAVAFKAYALRVCAVLLPPPCWVARSPCADVCCRLAQAAGCGAAQQQPWPGPSSHDQAQQCCGERVSAHTQRGQQSAADSCKS